MNKKSLYLLLHFSTAVVANWITIEHEIELCDMNIPGKYAAFHINEDDPTMYYTSSLMMYSVENLKNEPSFSTYNLTMWGCKFDCSFNVVLQLNKNNGSVSVLTNNTVNNYQCLDSNYTQNVIPTPKITYNDSKPDRNHTFPPLLTLDHCSKGLHPDYPGTPIDPAFDVHTCIDRLTGYDDGTYAGNLHFGKGSSFSPDGWDVATYHLINSANNLFTRWDTHHQALHDAFVDLSNKMTPDSFKSLATPPKKSHTGVIVTAVILGLFAVVGAYVGIVSVVGFARGIAEATELTIELGKDVARINQIAENIDDELVTQEEGFAQIDSIYNGEGFKYGIARLMELVKGPGGDIIDTRIAATQEDYYLNIGRFYDDENIQTIIGNLQRGDSAASGPSAPPPKRKREASPDDNIGFYSINLMNQQFVTLTLSNLCESLSEGEQPDISTYLSSASERLMYHFNETLYNNYFTANMSMVQTFTGTQVVNSDQILADSDEIYGILRNNTYNSVSALFLSNVLETLNIVVCDPVPSFCGQTCQCTRASCPTTWHCPRIGKDQCVMNIQPYQVEALQTVRDISDICSNNSTGWNITHNPNCDTKLFECRA